MPDLALFQAAVENSYDVVELLQEDGTILYINSTVKRGLGFEPHALIGTNHFELVHPDDKDRLQEELSLALALEQGEVSAYRCRTANGQWRWFNSSVSRADSQVFSESGRIILNSRDITEQEETRLELASSHQQMHAIWENITDAFFALDNQWNFTYINRAGERVLERRREDLLGNNVWDEFPAAVDSLFFQQYQLAMREQKEVTFEEFYSPLNTWFEVHAYPSENGLAVYFCNINQRKQIEMDLRESEERFRRIFEEGPMGIVLATMDAKVVHVNARLCQMLGYTEQELKALPIAAISHPDDMAEDARLMGQLLAGEFPSYQLEKRYITKEGRILWGSLSVSLIRDENNVPLYGSGIVEDITERKEAQERLRQSEANLATAQQIAHMGSWELDLLNVDDLSSNPLHWSDQTFRICGYEPREVQVTSETFFRAVHPEDRERVSAMLDRALRGEGVYDLNHRIVWPDGSEHIIHGKANLIRHEVSGEPVKMIGTAQDITQRVRDEETNARLVAIVESSADAIISKNLDGIITTWNSGAEQMYGYTAEEAIGQHMGMLLRPGSPKRESLLLNSVKNGQRVRGMETHCVRKDGQSIDVSISGAPLLDSDGEIIGISSITRDITEQKRAKIEREQFLVLLEATLESTADGILVVNDQGQITHYNKQFANMWRIPDEVISARDNTQAVEFVKEQLTDPNEFAAGAYTSPADSARSGFDLLHFKDGRVFERFTKVLLLKNKDLGRVWSFRDITEKARFHQKQAELNVELENHVAQRTAELAHKNRELEAEVVERRMAVGALREVVTLLEQAKQEAERANRAKSEFLSRMSHELRTPMNAILGFGQLLEMSPLDDKDRVGVEQILHAGRHLLQLINEVLEIARIEAGHLSLSIEPVELSSMVREAMDLVHPLAQQRRITLLNSVESDSWQQYVLGDKTRLHQVMINLLSNAIKYNVEGGSVIVALQEVSGSLRILVSDTGPGIALENQQKIFLPFERLGVDTAFTEGTGIGLTLTKSLAELMGGEIGLESNLGQGSTFWIQLPLAEKPVQNAISVSAPPALSSTLLPSLNRPLTFLYIEDNSFNLKLMEALLEKAPQVRLLTATQGGVGLDIARQRYLDLILLDVHLPDMVGLEVLRQLQSDPRTSGIPVVMVSADAISSQINDLLAAGARHYLTKPFGFKQFVQVVEDVLKKEEIG